MHQTRNEIGIIVQRNLRPHFGRKLNYQKQTGKGRNKKVKSIHAY